MKNYDPKIAAKKIVITNTQHGLSRHKSPDKAKTKVCSIMTEAAHMSSLTVFSRWLLDRNNKHLKNSNSKDAKQYLEYKATCTRQSTVSLARQAINLHLLQDDPIPFVRSQISTTPKNRAYTRQQISLLVEMATPELGLSILLAADAGLREMELVSIAEVSDLEESDRPWLSERFTGRERDHRFVVHGKGGLLREVRLKQELAALMRSHSRPTWVQVAHRGAHLISHFDLVSGHMFASQFGRLSKRVLGFSNGAHGLRHSFAQLRRNELLCCGFSLEKSVLILSEELGHFSIKNTLAYLRDQ